LSCRKYTSEVLGIEVTDLTPAIARKLGLGDISGVVITAVRPDSAAASEGIHKGMAIIRIGHKPVRSVNEFKAALQSELLEKGILLLVRTQNGNYFVPLKG
jgi:serine protease Do